MFGQRANNPNDNTPNLSLPSAPTSRPSVWRGATLLTYDFLLLAGTTRATTNTGWAPLPDGKQSRRASAVPLWSMCVPAECKHPTALNRQTWGTTRLSWQPSCVVFLAQSFCGRGAWSQSSAFITSCTWTWWTNCGEGLRWNTGQKENTVIWYSPSHPPPSAVNPLALPVWSCKEISPQNARAIGINCAPSQL